jgi:tetratricopeptide (TPR) repeat protein
MMKKYIPILLLLLFAVFTCGFDWSFGLGKNKCIQAKKIISGWPALKDEAKKEQEENQVLSLCPSGPGGHYVKALRLEKEGDLDGAIDEYRQSVKGDPAFPEAEGNLGLAYMKKGMRDEAAPALTMALEKINDPRYHKALGKIFSDRKFIPMALYHYKEALKSLPGDASIHIGLAEIYAEQKNAGKAEEEYRQAIALEPDNEEAKLGFVRLCLKTDQPDKALDELKIAMNVNPANREIHHLLGETYEKKGELKRAEQEYRLAGINRSVELMQQIRSGNESIKAGDYEKAVMELRSALREKPRDPATLQKLGDTYMAAGRDDEALATYKEAIRIRESSDIHYNLGILYERKGLFDEAVVEYRQALKNSIKNTDIRRRLAEIYTMRGSFPQAIEQYKELIRTNNDNPLYHLKLASIYSSTRNYKDAISEYRETIRIDPDQFEAHKELAVLYRKTRMDDEAETEYKEALRLKKDDSDSRNSLLALYVKKRKYDDIISLLRENVEISPNDPVSHYKLGLIYEFTKDYDASIGEYKKAAELKSDYAKALNAMGRVYLKTGHFTEARETLEAAKKADPGLAETSVLLSNIKEELTPEPQTYRKKHHDRVTKGKSGRKSKSSKKSKKAKKVKDKKSSKSKKAAKSVKKKGSKKK